MKTNEVAWRFLSWVACAGALLPAGCAKVDTRADYDKVQRHLADATGQEAIYRPVEDDAVAGQVTVLLEGGLTLDESVQIALLNNPTLQAAFMEIGMARADLVQSGLLLNPFLGVMLQFPSSGGLANLQTNLAQDIAHLWRIPVRKRAAEGELDRAILALARQAATVAAEAKTAYSRAVGTAQLQEITKENLDIARQLVELALARQAAGAGDQLDVNLARGLMLEAELVTESARLTAGEGRRTLARALGLTANANELRLLDALPATDPAAAQAEELVALAGRRRLDLQAAEKAVGAAKARWREQVLLVFPTLEIGLAMERDERRREGGRDLLADTARASIAAGELTAPDIEPRSARDDSQQVIIGPSIGLELPVFDQNQAQIAKARFAYQQAAKTREALARAVVQEVRSAADQMATAWRLVAIYRDQSLPLAENNLELSRASYVAGKASFLAVLEAQRSALSIRTRYIEALQAAAVTLPALENAVGMPMGEIRAGAASVP